MTESDVAGLPCILLDARLNVVHVTPAARRWLSGSEQVLAVRQQRLHSPAAPQALARGLETAARGRRTALCLARPARTPLTLSAEPRPTSLGGGVLVTLRDPELEQPDPALLQALFGLTPTEAIVAAGLAQGLGSAELASAMGVQPNTVLSHIKRVLLKSGTRRQSQLVSLILRSAAMPPHPRLPSLEGAGPSLAQTGSDAHKRPGHSPPPMRSATVPDPAVIT